MLVNWGLTVFLFLKDPRFILKNRLVRLTPGGQGGRRHGGRVEERVLPDGVSTA